MRRILIWDIPVRIFHWLLAASFIGAFAIANLVDDDSALFAVHMLLGGVMVFMIALRVIWGFVGSRWARFSSFALAPTEVLAYVKGVATGTGREYDGHNPGASVAAIAMFALVAGLAATGLLMSTAEVFEELHEVFAWSMVAVVVVHLAGIVSHTIRRRENIAMSMLDGRKAAKPSAAIPSARPVAGLLFVTLTGFWAASLVNGYDGATGRLTLPVIGQTIQLGEAEGGEAHGHGAHEDRDSE